MVGRYCTGVLCSSYAGHLTTETAYGQTLALWLEDWDEHRALELDTTGLNVKGNLCLYTAFFTACILKAKSNK